jgi:hypothetical protein
MRTNQPASAEQRYFSPLTSAIGLFSVMVGFTGCGFVLAPIESVAVGTLSAVVKEIDGQIQYAKHSRRESALVNQEQITIDGPAAEPLVATKQPSAAIETQIIRTSIMP